VPAGNDAWHREAAEITGAPYKPDAVDKEKDKVKKAINQEPRVVSKKAPAKAGTDGALPMRLENMMNKDLVMANMAEPPSGGVELPEKMQLELNKYRAKLYNEFYEKRAHEYEIRAEMGAKRKAETLARKRVKKARATNPNSKVDKKSQVQLYVQARKEVDNHSIRKYQRKFSKDLAKWATNKVFNEQERLKGLSDQKNKDDQTVALEVHREVNAKKVKGEDSKAVMTDEKEAVPKKEQEETKTEEQKPAETKTEKKKTAEKTEEKTKEKSEEKKPAL